MKRLIGKIKTGLQDSGLNRLAENFVSLSVLQVINYILPLVTLPFLVRVLGVNNFGLVMFAASFIQYFLIITDYGFNLSATHEISVHRDEPSKISEIFFSVMILKFLLLILSLIILSAVVFSFDKFRSDWQVYIYSFGIVAGNALFPIWFFQGMERMKYITVMNIISKLIFTSLIFIVIRNQSDYIYVPIFNSLGYIVAGLISLIVLFRNFKILILLPSWKTMFGYLKSSSGFFLSRISVSMYSNSNMFVIGLFLGNTIAGYYSAAEKLFLAMRMIYSPLNTALFPYMSKVKNRSLYKKIFLFVVSGNVLLGIFVFLLSGLIIKLMYGDGFDMSVNLLRIFSATVIVMVPSIMLGYPYLAALGYPKYANYSVIAASIFHIGLLAIMIPYINPYIVAAITFFTEFLVLSIRVYGVKKYDLWSVQ